MSQSGQSLTVGLLQIRAFALADHEQAWAELLRRIDDAAAESPRLIVAPEASYPAAILGSREAYARTTLRGDAEVLATLGDRARRHGCYVAVGLVLRDPFGAPQNAAVLIAPGGAVIARATEISPARWFAPGSGPIPARIDDTPVALFAGRDALDASRVAALADGGARVLVSTGAATAWGHALDRLGDAEAHLQLAARAVESGTWAATPAKVGLEAGSRVYAGRAGVVSPAGAWVVRAPGDRPGIVLHTIDLEAAPARPAVAAAAIDPVAPPAEPASTVVAVIAVAPTPSAVDLMETLRALARSAAAQGAGIIVLPDLAGAETRAITSAETLPLLEALAEETQTVVTVALAERIDGETYKTAYVIDRGQTIAGHRQSCLSAAERGAGFAPGASRPPAVATSAGRIGVLCGVEGLVPALTAALVQDGAAFIAWCAGDIGVPVEPLARVRAIEADCVVLAAGAATPSGGGSIVDAGGTVLATTLDGQPMTAFATIRRPAGLATRG
ncbi:MAG: carbon-nitrogen hydrolase family protein [Dehalococcoidia bacterium]